MGDGRLGKETGHPGGGWGPRVGLVAGAVLGTGGGGGSRLLHTWMPGRCCTCREGTGLPGNAGWGWGLDLCCHSLRGAQRPDARRRPAARMGPALLPVALLALLAWPTATWDIQENVFCGGECKGSQRPRCRSQGFPTGTTPGRPPYLCLAPKTRCSLGFRPCSTGPGLGPGTAALEIRLHPSASSGRCLGPQVSRLCWRRLGGLDAFSAVGGRLALERLGDTSYGATTVGYQLVTTDLNKRVPRSSGCKSALWTPESAGGF